MTHTDVTPAEVNGTCATRFAAVRDLPDEQICFWGGRGGSVIAMDLGREMTISYMMNKMGPGIIGSDRSEAYVRAVYGS